MWTRLKIGDLSPPLKTLLLKKGPTAYSRRGSVLLDHLKANLGDARKAKLSRGGRRHINYSPTHEGTTIIERPVRWFVTRTFVPKGNERCAAVIP